MSSLVQQLAEWDSGLIQASQSLRWSLLTPLFVVASAAWVKWPLFIAAGAASDVWRRRVVPQTAIYVTGAVAVAASLVTVFKDLAGRARPPLADPSVIALVPTPESASWPSGHSATAFAAATVLGALCPRLRWPFLALAALVAFSRVYLGVHYVLDVVAGSALGIAVGICVVAFARRVRDA